MSDVPSPQPKAVPFLQSAGDRLPALLALAMLMATLGLAVPHRTAALALLTSGATLLGLVAIVGLLAWRAERRERQVIEAVSAFIHNDVAASFLTEADGRLIERNVASKERFPKVGCLTLASALSDTFANPSGFLHRLQVKAEKEGTAQEDIVTRLGHIRVAVQRLSANVFAWRVDPLPQRAKQSAAQDGRGLPMIMIGRNDTVLFMNDAARAIIGGRSKSLDQIFVQLPVMPGEITEISTTDGPQRVLIAETQAGAGRRSLYLLPATPSKQAQPGWQMFQDIPVPLIKMAPDGTIQAFNRMAANLIGVQLAEDIHLSQLMEGLGRSITDWLSDTLAGRLSQKSEFLRLTRSDREAFVQVTLNRITEEGKPAVIAVLTDATELKTLEAQFVQSQKMQAIGQLAGGVAHDFNNLLTAISGHCDLLLLRHDQGDPDFADLVQINQNANRAAALVGQLLAFSRKQTLRPETLDMRDTLADLTHLLNRLVGETITLTLSHDPVLKPIRADKRQLEQVLMNLVVNARDAMPAGGEIRIVTECTTLKEPLVRDRASVPPGQYVTVEVNDDGGGIPADKLQKVFEPFFTTKRTGEGTGLGLSTAYGIVKQSGGFIFVDSTVGVGTSFVLYFPVLEVTETAPPRVAAPKQEHTGKHDDGVILLVEDEAPVRAFASRALRLRGYTVLEAESAEAALKTLEDAALEIDVFVTDVVMPGMDGPSWVREALKQRPDVRVVFVSGYAEDSFDEAQTNIPNSVFLPKPFSLNDLTDTVHKQLH